MTDLSPLLELIFYGSDDHEENNIHIQCSDNLAFIILPISGGMVDCNIFLNLDDDECISIKYEIRLLCGDTEYFDLSHLKKDEIFELEKIRNSLEWSSLNLLQEDGCAHPYLKRVESLDSEEEFSEQNLEYLADIFFMVLKEAVSIYPSIVALSTGQNEFFDTDVLELTGDSLSCH